MNEQENKEAIKYKDGYTMEEMIDRVVYWFFRYKGTHKFNGKEFSKNETELLSRRVKELAKNPDKFVFEHPDMGVEY